MKYLFLVAGIFMNVFIYGQAVKNTSYTTRSGEKVLRLELTVPIDKENAWQLFAKDELLEKWIAPVAHIELKTGGYIVTNYDKAKPLSDSTSIRLKIVNYIEKELLTLKVKLNDAFPKSVQHDDGNLQELIQFIYVGPQQTKIVSSMVGWGQGSDWDRTYNFFVKGNTWTYEQLAQLFK
jgi:hypothetical protein